MTVSATAVVASSPNGEVSLAKMPTAKFRREVRQLLHDRIEISENADPADVVDRLLQEFVKLKRYDLLVTAARYGLLEMAWELLRRGPDRRAYARGSAGQSGKWAGVAQAAKDRPDIFLARVATESGWKFLADCTRADLEFSAERKLKQASGLTDNAERLKRLARKLQRGQVVSDLERPVVEGIFDVP